MLRNRPLVAIVVTAILVSLLLGVVSHDLQKQTTRLQNLWEVRYLQTNAQQMQLGRLRQSVGYGGLIHHFKNFLLRREEFYVPLIEASFNESRSAIQALQALMQKPENLQALHQFTQVLDQYEKNFHYLRKLMDEQPKSSTVVLDRLIKVDDEPAWRALGTLSANISAMQEAVNKETRQQLAQARMVQRVYQLIVIPVVYLGAFGCVIYLLQTNRAYTKQMALFSATPDAMLVTNVKGEILQCNENAQVLFGYSMEELTQLQIEDLVPNAVAERHRELRSSYIQNTIKPRMAEGKFQDAMGLNRTNTEFSAKLKDGSLIPIEVDLTSFYEGKKIRVLAVVRDLTQKKALERAAKMDDLTGLYNRASAEKALNNELSRAKRYNRDLAVVMIDIDHFKEINDSFGHAVGDTALVSVARVLRNHVRSSDMAARFGGEEFIMIYPETDLQSVFIVAEAIRADVEALRVPPIKRITASLGVAVYRGGDGTNTIDPLLKQADDALYKAKNSGRNQVCGENKKT